MAAHKILIVEDEPDVCASLQSFLSRRGFSVSTTASGSDALRIIPVFQPDLILLDLTLLDLSGIEVLKKLRRENNKIKVIIMTGQMLPFDEVDSVRALGVVEYLQKPVVLSQFEMILREVFGGGEVERQVGGLPLFYDIESPGEVSHKMANLLGVIRTKCEAFLLNERDGFHKDKTESERLLMAKGIMEEAIIKTEEAAQFLSKVRSK
ncbi:MAG: response regulator [Candidatus Omnitrophica bacterium]|nr:response regulator [Candidatus Omnitrophota bacterium]